MFNIQWETLDAALAQRVLEEVNVRIQHVLDETLKDPQQRETISQLQLTSLNWGSTAPEIQIISIQDGYTDKELKALQEKSIPKAKHTPVHLEKKEFDTMSMHSSIASSAILGHSGTPSVLMRMRQQKRPTVEPNPLLISVQAQQQYVQTRRGAYSVAAASVHSMPHHHHQQERPSMLSLQKPLLPTRICSIYSSNKKEKKWLKRDSLKDASLNNLPLFKRAEEQKDYPPATDLLDLDFVTGEQGILFKVYFCYDGNASVTISAEVALNVPFPKFVTFPVSVTLSHIIIEGELNIMYRDDKVYIFFERASRAPYSPLKDFSMLVTLGDETATEGGDLNPLVLIDKSKIEGLVKQQLTYAIKKQVVLPNILVIDKLKEKAGLSKNKQ